MVIFYHALLRPYHYMPCSSANINHVILCVPHASVIFWDKSWCNILFVGLFGGWGLWAARRILTIWYTHSCKLIIRVWQVETKLSAFPSESDNIVLQCHIPWSLSKAVILRKIVPKQLTLIIDQSTKDMGCHNWPCARSKLYNRQRVGSAVFVNVWILPQINAQIFRIQKPCYFYNTLLKTNYSLTIQNPITWLFFRKKISTVQ